MAEIVQLNQYRTLVKGSNGVKFPQLYRARGFYHESNEPSPLFYTLDETTTGGFANTTHEPIKGFDTTLDSGWLIIRHHMTDELAEGYFDAVYDKKVGREDQQIPDYLFKTATGIFSLQHRECTPGAPDHLVMYVTKVPEPMSAARFGLGNGWMDEYQVFLPDGSSTFDSDILYDPENMDF